MNLLDVGYWIAAAAAAPFWRRKPRAGWDERFARIKPIPPQAERPRILVHGVSVGEVSAVRQLVPLLAHQAEVVVCASTDTGIARARELYADAATVVRYPLDFSASVRRFLDAVRPSAVALVELEVWPNFVRASAARQVPVAVINGRLSARSFRGYRRVRWVMAPTFRRLALVAAQDETYARRFRALGVPAARCRVTGSMKWDSVDPDAPAEEREARARLLRDEMGIDPARPLVVAGSTGPGEESLIRRASPEGVQLLCAPRKPERFDEAARALPGCVRRSRRRGSGPGQGSPTGRYLLDTIGELGLAYTLADVVIVGRSFGRLHGSDPTEPAAMGKPLLIGPRFGDFATVVGALRQVEGIRVVRPEDLGDALKVLLDSPYQRRLAGARARECVRANRGASVRHAEMLLGLVRRSVGAAGE